MTDRLFIVTLLHPVEVPGSWGGHRRQFTYRTTEPGEAERLYWQENPEGPEPLSVEEV